MKLLRVLDLEGCDFSEEEDLEVIGQFTLLRYLNLRNTSIKSLPKSMGKLQNLETLDLRWTQVTQIPPQITKLHKLEYLNVGGFERDPSGTALACHGAEFPEGMTSLKALKTLGMVSFEKNPMELGEMTQLTKLGVKDITTRENAKAFVETLNKLSAQLHTLKVSWDCNNPSLEKVSQPPVHLKSLWLSGRLYELPRWIASLDCVSKIALAHTKLDEKDIQVLQKLPCLKVLVLFEKSYRDDELCFRPGDFPELKLLQIDRLDFLRKINFEGGGLQLEIIEIVTKPRRKYLVTRRHGSDHAVVIVARRSTSYNPLQMRRYTRPVSKSGINVPMIHGDDAQGSMVITLVTGEASFSINEDSLRCTID